MENLTFMSISCILDRHKHLAVLNHFLKYTHLFSSCIQGFFTRSSQYTIETFLELNYKATYLYFS
jgi:hypothetical protein